MAQDGLRDSLLVAEAEAVDETANEVPAQDNNSAPKETDIGAEAVEPDVNQEQAEASDQTGDSQDQGAEAEDAGADPEAAVNDEPPADGTQALINLLFEKGLLTEGEAKNLISRVEAESSQQEQEKIVRIERIKNEVKGEVRREVNVNRLRNQIKNEMVQEMDKRSANLGPEWAQRIRFGGDIRLRYQRENYQDSNALQRVVTGDPVLLNTTEDRPRYRARVRLKAVAEINPDTEAGIRLTTGNERDPVSTNETLGDYSNKDSIVIDQAYLRYKLIPQITLWGGRMPNPFFYTDLVYDNDLAFEGGAVQGEFPLDDHLAFFANVGVFALEEFELRDDDKWLYAYQAGFIAKPWRKDLTLKGAIAFYDFENLQGRPYDDTVPEEFRDQGPLFQQKGNTLFDIDQTLAGGISTGLASDYDIFDLLAELEIGFWSPVSIILTAEYVKNVGFDREEINDLTGVTVPANIEGYLAGVFVGYKTIKELWDWSVSLRYKYLEADAVLDAFTDSDFHAGGTNAQGYILSGSLGIGENLWLTSTWYTADEIDGPPLAVDVYQFDINARF